MRHARTRLTALALLAALAASSASAAGLLHAHHAAVLHPGPTGHGELRRERADLERCPPGASGSPTTRLAEPGYVPKPAGPPPTATTRRR